MDKTEICTGVETHGVNPPLSTERHPRQYGTQCGGATTTVTIKKPSVSTAFVIICQSISLLRNISKFAKLALSESNTKVKAELIASQGQSLSIQAQANRDAKEYKAVL